MRRVTFLAAFALMWLHARHVGVALAILLCGRQGQRCPAVSWADTIWETSLQGIVTGVATAATLSKVGLARVPSLPQSEMHFHRHGETCARASSSAE